MTAIETFKMLLASDTPPPDDQINTLLALADNQIKGYTFLPSVPVDIDDIRAYMALVLYNKQGAEGESRRQEGEVTSVYQPISEVAKVMLLPYRRARTGIV